MKEVCLCWGTSTPCVWATTPSATSQREPSEASRPYVSCKYTAAPLTERYVPDSLPRHKGRDRTENTWEHYLSAPLVLCLS